MAVQESNLSDNQEKALSLLPLLPSVLSVSASCIIIISVVGDSHKSPYKRILLALSVSDILSSVTIALQAFLVPRETSYRVWAIGNDASCCAVGALLQLGFSAFWYNCMLSFYYLLTVRFGIRDESIEARIEPWMHLVSIGYPLTTSISGVIMGVYNELDVGLGCWVSDYPEGCDTDDTHDCRSPFIGMMFAGYPFFVILICIAVNNIMIFAFVRKTASRATRRESFHRSNIDCPQVANTKAAATQAFLYVGSFVLTYLWSTILRFMESFDILINDEAALFPLLVLQAVFLPMLGVFTLLVFVRPQYLRCRSRYPEETRIWSFWKVLFRNVVPESTGDLPSSSSMQLNKASAVARNAKTKKKQVVRNDEKGSRNLEEENQQNPITVEECFLDAEGEQENSPEARDTMITK